MDYYYDLVFRLENGEMNLIASGYYGAEDNSNVQYDEEGDPIYLYEWEGVRMSREEYQTQLSQRPSATMTARCILWMKSKDGLRNIRSGKIIAFPPPQIRKHF